jgi:hypothetical protein
MFSQTAHPTTAPNTALIGKRAPRYVTVSAWAVPLLMVGQFALVAALPVALIAFAAIKDRRVRALRWWAGALAALYATPLVFWLVRANGAESLSKDIHPAFVALVSAAALVILAKIYRAIGTSHSVYAAVHPFKRKFRSLK